MARRIMDPELRGVRDLLIEDLYETGDYSTRDLAVVFNLHQSSVNFIVSPDAREAQRARNRERNRGRAAAAAQRRRRAARALAGLAP